MRRFSRGVIVATLGLYGTIAAMAQVLPKPVISTQWTDTVSKDAPWPEYPRPQLEREAWRSLNGRWMWTPDTREGEITGVTPPASGEYKRQVLVPFPIESMLSGVGEHHEKLWYTRSFEVPNEWGGQRVLLNFEAVDWKAVVYVNGRRVGEHTGGYDPFGFDITDALRPGEAQELIVGVFDPTDAGDQPRGKQVRKPEGIWYTPHTGIWQSVWLEAAPATHVSDLKIVPNAERGEVRVKVTTTVAPDAKLTLVATAGKQHVGDVEGQAGEWLTLKIDSPRLWSPNDPFLYGLTVTVNRCDTVRSYFGLRDIKVAKDEKGVNRLMLNGKECFMVGPLDQGYWPDGIVTAPTDEALRWDIVQTKALGFNMTRKHVKVEPARWYYWADREGLLVWQDMPSPLPPKEAYTEAGKRQYEIELRRLIDNRFNSPSIVMWVVFNEGWGQFETPRFTRLVKELDPSRLANNASGWTDNKVGDVVDVHTYPDPKCPPSDEARACVVGEFGGLGLPVPDHMWKKDHWGYQAMKDQEHLTRRYEQLLKSSYEQREQGLCAVVYTQITDVEVEANGLYTYDRRVLKTDFNRTQAANRGDFSLMPPPPTVTDIVPTSQTKHQEWRYTEAKPNDGWEKPGFDDSAWKRGSGGFGTKGTPGAVVGTEWKGGAIWIRRSFSHNPLDEKPTHLLLHHDEDCEVYINGVLVAKLSGWTHDYELVPIPDAAKRAFREGNNIIAAGCRQTGGGQFIDLGLVRVDEHPAPKADVPAGIGGGGAAVNLLPNPGFEDIKDGKPSPWYESRWSGDGVFAASDVAHSGKGSVKITSEKGGDISWQCSVPVEMMSRYRISGWIKAENLKPQGGAKGALLNVHNVQPVQTKGVTGTTDWTYVEVEFDTGYEDHAIINCLLGGWGFATGTAWFDDVSLTLVKRGELPSPSIAIDASKIGEPISPYIYGQFIEHLGRCIYGGIWAEMLEDRKFFDAVGQGESPWRAVNASVVMDETGPFVGKHSPRVKPTSIGKRAGIAQSGLFIKPGQRYVGRIYVAGDKAAGPIQVEITSPAWNGTGFKVQLPAITPEFTMHALSFPIPTDAPAAGDASISITGSGNGEFRVGTLSLMPDDNVHGFRADTLKLLKELDAPVYRWPGGNFVSGYDWRDGIGDQDQRPPRKNPAWRGIEHNDVGMHEFISLCRLLKTEPYIAINTGLGSVESGAAEVEYANGAASTAMGSLRAKNGSDEPFHVTFWGIGNEMYGSWQLGNVPLADYVKRHNAFVDEIRKVDANATLIAVGAAGDWSRTMLERCADHMTHMSEHVYWQERDGLLAHVKQAPESLRRIAESHRSYRRNLPNLKNRDIRIVQDEWNYWYGPELFGEIGTRYFMKDALGCAAALNEFSRNSDLFFMANYAQTVNVIGAIKTSKGSAALETTGLVLKLYRHHFGTLPVMVTTGPTIDASAAWSADKHTFTIAVVNATNRPVKVPLSINGVSLRGTGTRYTIAGDPMTFNDPSDPSRVVIREAPVGLVSDTLELEACSVTLLSLDVN